MGSKPLRDLFEEAGKKADEIFGDDSDLQSTQTWTPTSIGGDNRGACLMTCVSFFCLYCFNTG